MGQKNISVLRHRMAYLAFVASGLVAAGSSWAASFDFTSQTDWNTGVYTSTHTGAPPVGADGEVRLNEAVLTPFNHIWVALSGRDSAVRINTNIDPTLIGDNNTTLTMAEAGGTAVLGEYLTRPSGMAGNPSRTTVDANGDVWVGNRNESSGGLGSVTKISASPTGTTSTGAWNGSTFDRLAWTNAGNADSGGGVTTAADTAITNYVRTEGANVRHVSVDANNNVWVGGGPLDTGDQVFRLYDSSGVAVADPDGAGPKVVTFGDNGTGGYGGLVDGNGVVWSAGLNGNSLTRMDPATGARMTVNQNGRQSYGMGIDNNGYIWVATWTNNTVDKIDSNGNVVASYNLWASSSNYAANSLRGVAVTPDNNIWVASSGTHEVIRLDNNGNVLAQIAVGNTPTGVAVDSNGKIWVTNYGSNSVMRINPATNAVELTINLGTNANPYNYSDMTGTVLVGSTNPTGTWRRVMDGGVGANWDQIFWNQEQQGIDTGLLVEARVSNDGISWSAYDDFLNGEWLNLTGRFLEVRATFNRSAAAGDPVLSDLRVTYNSDQNVPEPGTLGLLAAGMLGLGLLRRRKAV